MNLLYGLTDKIRPLDHVDLVATCSLQLPFATLQVMPAGQNEAFSRVMIEKSTECSGWNLVAPYEAKGQVRGYAENLHVPFIIFSNCKAHRFWNFTRKDQDANRIEQLPSQADLERLRPKNLQPPRPQMSEIVTPDYLRAFKSDYGGTNVITHLEWPILSTDTAGVTK